MLERERTLYAFNLYVCEHMVADLREEQMRATPVPTINPPAWVLGHLCVTSDFAAQILGLGPLCPPAWHETMGMGVPPGTLPDPLPSKKALLDMLRANHERVSTAAAAADADLLNRPHGLSGLTRSPLQTLGDMLAHLMTTHEAMHIGQLSLLRRHLGYPPLV
jgi:hypothetical protein